MTEVTATATPVAIIGIGCLFPGAADRDAYWANIQAGVDAITEVPGTHWRPADYLNSDPKAPDRTYAARGGFLAPVPFPPLDFGITPKALEATDSTQLLGLMAARAALEDAGYGAKRKFDRNRASVILGVTGTLPLVIPLGARLGHPIWKKALHEAGVPDEIATEVMRSIADSYVGWQEDSFPGLLGNVVAGRIANRLDLGGTNCVVDAACASSLSALHLALLELAAGRSDLVLSGGMDSFNDIFMYMCFSKTPALSPTGSARPFDAGADGTILGEGLGCVVLKRLADAERDGDKIYAVLRGMGTSSDGKGQAVYAPSSAGQCKALRGAYRQAGITPDTIELVEAHGTGTRAGDAAEIAALNTVYREAKSTGSWCAVGSVKSQIGHTKAAAGAAGLIKAALALHHKVLPPTIKIEQPLPALAVGASPFNVSTTARPWLPRALHPRRAAVSAFGFGGSNFHCVLEEYQPRKQHIAWDGQVQIAAFAASSRAEVQQQADAFLQLATWDELRAAAAQSRAAYRSQESHRLTLVVQASQDRARLRQLLTAQWSKNTASWQIPDGAYYASGPQPGKLALLFPGQGSQYVGMLAGLACQFPQLLDTLAEANALFGPTDDVAVPRLSDLIYPPTAFDADARGVQEERLRATAVAQPALAAVSLGAWRLLAHFGVTADAVAGHSFGELTALCVAGRLTAEQLHRLAKKRGELMAQHAGGETGMLAVQMPLAQAAELLQRERIDLVLANRNAPQQAVLSGALGELERAADICAQRGISAKRLPVAGAFHSRFVARASHDLVQVLAAVNVQPGKLAVYANTTAALYPGDSSQARTLLARQLAEPVAFLEMIESMERAGVRIFVEVGPANKLTGLVRSILGERPHHAIALDVSQGKQPGQLDLAKLLAQLAALGVGVQLPRWDEQYRPAAPASKATLTIPICGANYVAPKREGAAPTEPERQRRAGRVPFAGAQAPQEHPGSIEPSAVKVTMQADHSNGTVPGTHSDGLLALQKLSEQTAQLHRQFLEGQERALLVLQELLRQQPGTSVAMPLSTVTSSMPAVGRASQPVPPEPDGLGSPSYVTPRQLETPVRHATNGMQPVGRASQPVPSEPDGLGSPSYVTPRQLEAPVRPATNSMPAVGRASQPVPPEPDGLGSPSYVTPRPLEVSAAEIRSVSPALPAPLPQEQRAAKQASALQPILLGIVAEKTGYPSEMLDLDQELDSDLGIDSIKRVEIFAALQEKLPQAPAITAEHLGTLRSLRDVLAFLEPATPATPPPQPVVVSAPRDSALSLEPVLLSIVAAKTGYPLEMLNLDQELDTDLGIDSIKRVEIFAALQERAPEAPAVSAEHLGTLRTLRQVLAFLERRDASNAPSTKEVQVVAEPVAPDIQGILLAIVADKTGYPLEMLNLDQELDTDLGIDSIKRVEIFAALQEQMPQAPAIQAEQLGTLRTLRQVVAFVSGSTAPARPSMSAAQPEEPPHRAVALPPVEPPLQRLVLHAVPLRETKRPELALAAQATIWLISEDSALAALTAERLQLHGYRPEVLTPAAAQQHAEPALLAGLLLFAPARCDADVLWQYLRIVQQFGPVVRRQAGAIVSVQRGDGVFGLAEASAQPTTAAFAGLVKTLLHEWPEVHAKALDVAAHIDDEEAALFIAAELLTQGPVEVGLTRDGIQQLELRATPHVATTQPTLQPSDVVLVTGGGRGVTAAVALALARTYRPTLVLLGRTPAPQPEPDWLAGLQSESDIKRALLTQSGGGASPRAIGEHYRQILAQRELRQNLAAMSAAGARVHYRAADVRDAAAVTALIRALRQELGPITGLVHGAGVLADRRVEEKTEAQFREVYETKVTGLCHLLAALAAEPLRVLALFSSSTGRFGRAGQVDYAMANEVLNKLAQHEARRRPGCRVAALNWGPWDGGMVGAGLKQLFQKEGLALIPLQAGAHFLLHELAQPAPAPAEIVVLAGASVPQLPTRVPQDSAPTNGSIKLRNGTVHTNGHTPALRLAFTRELSVAQCPVLRSHVIQGRAVVPAALIAEWLAHAALHGQPGLQLLGFEQLRILKGIKLDADAVYRIRVLAGAAQPRGHEWLVATELHGTCAEGRDVLHARADLVLGQQLPAAPPASALPALARYPHELATVYAEILFHGPDLHGITHIDGLDARGISAQVNTAPAPAQWLRQPLRTSWLMDPLVLDGAFQMMVLWTTVQQGAGSLPSCIGSYRQYRRAFPRTGVRVVARVTERGALRCQANVDFLDAAGAVVAQLTDYECILDASLRDAFRRNRLPEPAVLDRHF